VCSNTFRFFLLSGNRAVTLCIGCKDALWTTYIVLRFGEGRVVSRSGLIKPDFSLLRFVIWRRGFGDGQSYADFEGLIVEVILPLKAIGSTDTVRCIVSYWHISVDIGSKAMISAGTQKASRNTITLGCRITEKPLTVKIMYIRECH
jgi:hypothetical protein